MGELYGKEMRLRAEMAEAKVVRLKKKLKKVRARRDELQWMRDGLEK